jgi:hypothetical protein
VERRKGGAHINKGVETRINQMRKKFNDLVQRTTGRTNLTTELKHQDNTKKKLLTSPRI